VLEGVDNLGEKVRFMEELGRLQVCQAVLHRRLWDGSSITACSTGRGTSRPITAAVCSSRLSSGGNRSIRAARTACTEAGTWIVGRACTRRYAPPLATTPCPGACPCRSVSAQGVERRRVVWTCAAGGGRVRLPSVPRDKGLGQDGWESEALAGDGAPAQ
jgi:hypothetical protein